MAVVIRAEPERNRESVAAVRDMRVRELPKAMREDAWIKDWCEYMVKRGINVDRVVKNVRHR